MKLSGVAVALVVAFCLPQAVLAWNATGHELVAGIAWDNMTPAARKNALAFLRSAPGDACLLDLFPNDARPQAERDREFFMRAATWADRVRKDKDHPSPCDRFSDTNAHFIDHFWQGQSGGTGGNTPHDRPDFPGKPVNAIIRLNAFRTAVACTAGPCPPAAERATDLAWILHLVGDIHQPLHTASRLSGTPPTDDGGGNGFPLSTDPHGPQLHSFWDDIVDESIPLQAGEANQKSIKYLNRVIAKIVADHPRSSLVNRLTPVDFEAWSGEGFKTVKQLAYPATLHAKQTPSAAYRASVFTVADEAIALGGYRLANLLNTILGGAAPAAAAALSIPPHLPRPSHIVIVIDENKRFSDVIAKPPKAPYISDLAARGALLNVFAFHHPSQPNYMELFAGDRLGVCEDECPIGPFNAQNLGAALIAAGKSFAGFAENLPATGARSTCNGLFRAKHAPWVDFSNIPASASRDFTTQFPRTAGGDFDHLPVVSLVIPNMTDDMHDGGGIPAQVNTGNNWLRDNLSAYADWAEHHNSLLIVTWDEDSSSFTKQCPATVITTAPPNNRIATIIMGEHVIPKQNPPDQYNHHNLLRTILDMYGIAPFAGATTAKDITGIWQ